MLEIYQKGIDKDLRTSIVNDTLAKVHNGEIDPLELHISLKNIEAICKAVSEDKAYKSAVLEKVENNGKSYEYSNAKIDIREVGVKYDYLNCNDIHLIELQAKLDEFAKDVKTRQDFLKGVPTKGLDVVDTDTGETYTIYPPTKTSTTSTVVTLK